MRKHICVGLLAHVDAGKTTLAEGFLYTCGRIRKLGRVDHGDVFLDNFAMERERGITIFSKQARIAWEGLEVTLLDTPGHVDFSAEMERTLQVMDYALLVISGTDGVQGHTRTLWRLLKQYHIPVFLFVNKMDQPDTDRGRLLKELQEKLDPGCVAFGSETEENRESFLEELAMCAEGMMEEYLDTGEIALDTLAEAIAGRQVFPCYFGSALRLEGVEELLLGMRKYCLCPVYPEQFGARVYKISRDSAGNRLTHLKVTGGVLRVKMPVSNAEGAAPGEEIWEEKADQIRIYGGLPDTGAKGRGRRERDTPEAAGGVQNQGTPGAAGGVQNRGVTGAAGGVQNQGTSGAAGGVQNQGTPGAAGGGQNQGTSGAVEGGQNRSASGGAGGAQYCSVEQVEAGEICAVMGFGKTYAGQGLGREHRSEIPILAPVLTYALILPEGTDAVKVLGRLRKLEEEEPQLHVVWQEAGFIKDDNSSAIHVQVMGEVQMEVLKRQLAERFGLEAEFGDGHIIYQETIAEAVVGIGHYEPLRHYAEVHLLLEPGERGSGLQFASACSEDVLDRNWQRLVLTHLEEKSHRGVLTGAPLTDMKITLLTGRAHKKHTEGGDFRQATYRAIRQGLMQSKSVLLEPVFSFSMEVPSGQIGRAMSDIQRMQGSFEPPVVRGEYAFLTGSVPVSEMKDYQRELTAYTKGLGRLSCILKGYEPCHNAEEIMRQTGYEPDRDTDNPASSIFCAHGAGVLVDWDKVPDYAHLENGWSPDTGDVQDLAAAALPPVQSASSARDKRSSDYITLDEIDEIFRRTYGKSTKDYAPYRYSRRNAGNAAEVKAVSEVSGGKSAEAFLKNAGETQRAASPQTGKEEYLLVDGYNIIFAWEDLRSLAEINIDSARDKLMDICSNYQGFMGCTLILVYDAYKVIGNPGSILKYHNIYVVYTKEAETADQYIEKTVHKIGKKYQVTVATSDALEQMIIWGDGAMRLSALGFREAVDTAARQIRDLCPDSKQPFHTIQVPKL